MRGIVIAFLVCAGCGRVGFDDLTDDEGAGSDNSGSGSSSGRFEPQGLTHTGGEGPVDSIDVDGDNAGHMLVIMFSQQTDMARALVGITDDAPGGSNTYKSANARTTLAACTTTTEIWFASNLRSGTSSLTLTFTLNGPADFEVTVLDFLPPSGSPGVVDGRMAVSDQPAATQVQTPSVAPSRTPALGVAMFSTCGSVNFSPTASASLQFSNFSQSVGVAYGALSTVASVSARIGTTSAAWTGSTVILR